MTLYHRLRDWLGLDTTATYTHGVPLYCYEINYDDGLTYETAHSHERDGERITDLVVYEDDALVNRTLRRELPSHHYPLQGKTFSDEPRRVEPLPDDAVVEEKGVALTHIEVAVDLVTGEVMGYDIDEPEDFHDVRF